MVLGIQSLCQEPIRIDVAAAVKCTEEPKLSYFTDEITYVKLETNANCLIGNIGQIKRVGDNLVIYDRSTQRILVFSITGRYLNHISKIGKGPGEYQNIRNGFTVDPLTNDVIIVNLARKTLMRYRLDGTFLGEIKLDYYTTKLGFIGAKLICYSSSAMAEVGQKSHLITVIDRDGNKLGNFHETKKLCRNPSDHPVVSYNHEGSFRYWERPFNAVYEFDGKTIRKAFTIDYGGDGMPEDYYYDNRLQTKIRDYLLLNTFREFENFVMLRTISKGEGLLQNIYYYPESGKTYISSWNKQFKNWGMIDDINGGPLFSMFAKISEDEVCNPLEYIDYVSYKESGLLETQEYKSKQGHDKLIEIMNSTTISDNPILQIIKLK